MKNRPKQARLGRALATEQVGSLKWFNLNGHPVKRDNSDSEVCNDCTKKTQIY